MGRRILSGERLCFLSWKLQSDDFATPLLLAGKHNTSSDITHSRLRLVGVAVGLSMMKVKMIRDGGKQLQRDLGYLSRVSRSRRELKEKLAPEAMCRID